MKRLHILIFLIILGCSTSEQQIEKIIFYYLPEATTTSVPIEESEEIFHHPRLLKKKVVSNDSFLKKFSKNYSYEEQLNPDYNIDIRIVSLIYYKDLNRIDTLSLGSYFGTLINSKQVIDIPKVLELIKKELYNYSTYENTNVDVN